MSAVVVGFGAFIVVIIAIAITSAGTAASALLVKYGLEFRRRSSKMEVDVEKMCSNEILEIKDAPDLSFHECVEIVIAAAYYPEDQKDKAPGNKR